ncbi:Hypothetical predicted protein [Olea europaea subsp. europaea]|uniref:Uncharacterized protein n=1 Tax=Olea europaea subsp. europaea TaxID=158383 RepID=A0A8S0R5G8_OLEEU|nr:Hypothetical predicted protein [Olea europaea subsp. europaea]
MFVHEDFNFLQNSAQLLQPFQDAKKGENPSHTVDLTSVEGDTSVMAHGISLHPD